MLSDQVITLSTNCLFAIKESSPLNLAFETLLVPSSGVAAVKSKAMDLQELVEEVGNLNSEVLIIEDAVITMEESSLAHMLFLNPALKLIVVLKADNHVRIIRKDEIQISSASEFLEIIRSK